jgi:hypothetical protein
MLSQKQTSFIRKIAAKETDETIYWLELSQFIYASNLISPLLDNATSIHKVLNKIIGSSKASLSKQS